jgi:pimeloyl-ACP methyl ester carboxylesterase/DNA-binding CsgD family transcriptional regulator
MEPRIRFTGTRDKVNIAYWSEGTGPALVHLPWQPWSHIGLELEYPDVRQWYEALWAKYGLVRYDGRGTGLSDRDVASIGLESQVLDLEAVVDRLELKRFTLLGVYHSGPAAITFAARYPDRVDGLILWSTYSRGADYYKSPRVRAIRDLLDDWELYTETGAHAFVGWSRGHMAHFVAGLMRASVAPDTARRFFEEVEQVDVSSLLPQLQVPVLVVHPRSFPLWDIDITRQMAAAIPGAHFLVVEGDSLAPMRSDAEKVTGAISDFIAANAAVPSTSRQSQPAAPLDPKTWALTPQEFLMLRLVAQGKTNREIAKELTLSIRTIEHHIGNAYSKVGVTNRSQATAFVLDHGLNT